MFYQITTRLTAWSSYPKSFSKYRISLETQQITTQVIFFLNKCWEIERLNSPQYNTSVRSFDYFFLLLSRLTSPLLQSHSFQFKSSLRFSLFAFFAFTFDISFFTFTLYSFFFTKPFPLLH